MANHRVCFSDSMWALIEAAAAYECRSTGKDLVESVLAAYLRDHPSRMLSGHANGIGTAVHGHSTGTDTAQGTATALARHANGTGTALPDQAQNLPSCADGSKHRVKATTKTKDTVRASRAAEKKTPFDYALEIEHWRATADWKPDSKPFQALVEFAVAYSAEFKETPVITQDRDLAVFKRVLPEFAVKRIALSEAFRVYWTLKFYRDRGCPASGMGDARALAEIVKKAKRIEVPDETEPVRPRHGPLQVGVNGLLAVDAWAQILAAAKDEVDSDAFKAWFSQAVGAGFDGTTLIVITENSSQKRFLLANWSNEISGWAQKVRDGMDVAFEVREDVE